MWEGLRGCQCPSLAFPRDLQHIHYPRNHPGHGTSPPFSILIIGEDKAVVLRQQGSCVHLGEVPQCISRQVLSIGYDQCPSEQDLKLSTAHKQNHCWGVGAIAGLYHYMPTPWNVRVVYHPELLPWADSFCEGTYWCCCWRFILCSQYWGSSGIDWKDSF
jgi:hypothetical protein